MSNSQWDYIIVRIVINHSSVTFAEGDSSEEELQRLMTSTSSHDFPHTSQQKSVVSLKGSHDQLVNSTQIIQTNTEKTIENEGRLTYENEGRLTYENEEDLRTRPSQVGNENGQSISGASNSNHSQQDEPEGDDMLPKPKWHPPWQLKQVIHFVVIFLCRLSIFLIWKSYSSHPGGSRWELL